MRCGVTVIVTTLIVSLAPTLVEDAAAASASAVAAAADDLVAVLSEPQVNRTVPTVDAPPVQPQFSATPTTEEITQARIFPEPLVAVGGVPTDAENAALAPALLAYHDQGGLAGVAALEQFLGTYPQSAWRASLLANLGVVYQQHGAFTRALNAWDQAWALAKDATDAHGRAVADGALAAAARLASNFGQIELTRSIAQRASGRDVHGAAASRIRQALEQIGFIEAHPESMIASGPEALKTILVENRGQERQQVDNLPTFAQYQPTTAGTSLADVAQMASAVGLDMRLAQRGSATSVPVPSVVHWRIGHFSAVVEARGSLYRVRDVALGGSRWIDGATLLAESSGNFLVPTQTSLDAWPALGLEAAAAVIGHSCPPGGPEDSAPPDNCPSVGMPSYEFHPVEAALHIVDAPLRYRPPRGPACSAAVSYNHRDKWQPQTFSFGNLGPRWTPRWLSYVEEEPTSTCLSSGCVWLYLPGGWIDTFAQPDVNGVYAAHWRTRATLIRTSTSPLAFELHWPNGTIETFGLSDGGTPGSRRVFRTQISDPQGLTQSFTYDSQFRLVAVTDAIGQVTTLEYASTVDPLKITKITDPFGRTAQFGYNTAGELSSITDAVGMTSTFAYGAEDFIVAMTTPYGTTTFRQEFDSVQTYNYRFIEATDPTGGTERLEFRWQDAGIAATEAAGNVPTGFSTANTSLDHYNSVYWSKRAWALGAGDMTKATITHWLYEELWPGGTKYSVPAPHSIKRPLERRVWFSYPGQPTPADVGTSVLPSKVAQVLDDGTSQIWQATYNAQNSITSSTDPLGRVTTFSYATNGVDLQEVRQTTTTGSDLLASFGTYNTQHRPASVTDAAGQTSSFTYNTAGQLLTLTNPKNETTTYVYDANGYLQSVTGAVTGATTAYTYDTVGRIHTVTESDGYALTYDYDALNRPTKTTYPDSTFEEIVYDRLHPGTIRDRLGRVTRMLYDGEKRVTSVRDPLGRVIAYDWCACGSLNALIDANGHRTTWERDVEDRVTREVRADGTTATSYTYDGVGRLTSLTDPKAQVKTYSYLLDDALGGISYTNASVATPNVSFTYDSVYPRRSTMVDGLGTTTYAYNAAGQLGAGDLASIDGPRTNDTLTYTYDELGRVTNRALNSVGVTWAYDALDRLTSEVNPLGTFAYTYDGTTPRLATATYPNGQTSLYSYYGNSSDRRLQTIHHKLSGGATLSKFDYTYDVVGNILTWQQQADSASPTLWTYGYDAADQLISAVKQTTAAPPTVLARYGYSYDPGGNRTTEQVDDVVTGATHDALNRLLAHTASGSLRVRGTLSEAATVTVDGVPAVVDASNSFSGSKALTSGTNTFTVTARDYSGNSQSKTYQVDAAGESGTFTYDANGNMTGDGTRTFEWDAENRLAAVTIGTHRSEFTYDGENHRTRIVEKQNGATLQDPQLFWADDQIIEERLTTGEVNRFFEDGEDHNGSARYLTRDHLNSVREATDSTDAVVTRDDYDPYGRLTRVGGTEDSRFGFTGHMVHAPSGLVLPLYRAYEPSIGRWLSEDPLGIREGPSMYEYVANRPLDHTDPLGLYNKDVHYYVTRELAQRAGFNLHDAERIAQADQGVDDNNDTSPMPPGNIEARRNYHFTTEDRRRELREKAMKSGCLEDIGTYLHALQDSYSHQKGQKDRDGEPYGPVFGHLADGHDPDYPEKRPELYQKMRENTLNELIAFRKNAGGKKK